MPSNKKGDAKMRRFMMISVFSLVAVLPTSLTRAGLLDSTMPGMEKTFKALLEAGDLNSCVLIDFCMDRDFLQLIWLDCSTMCVFEEWVHLTADSMCVLRQEGGNRAAGTRIRKQMQKVKQAAQVVRNRVLEIRSAQ
jgi:hypothetical protein